MKLVRLLQFQGLRTCDCLISKKCPLAFTMNLPEDDDFQEHLDLWVDNKVTPTLHIYTRASLDPI
jgi:hypothetical protein